MRTNQLFLFLLGATFIVGTKLVARWYDEVMQTAPLDCCEMHWDKDIANRPIIIIIIITR